MSLLSWNHRLLHLHIVQVEPDYLLTKLFPSNHLSAIPLPPGLMMPSPMHLPLTLPLLNVIDRRATPGQTSPYHF